MLINATNLIAKITLKTNGFALGSVRKGYFKTENGEIVKLILNAENKPYILLKKLDGKKIYFSAREASHKNLVGELEKTFPNLLILQPGTEVMERLGKQ